MDELTKNIVELQITGSMKEELSRLGPWYHSFESFGITVPQCEGHYRINQKCKEGTILAYLQLAIEKIKYSYADEPSVLELFCADGYYAAHARRMGAGTVTGVDLDERAIEQATAMHRALFSHPGEFLVGDVHSFVASDPYDIVLCCGGLYHLTDPRQLVESCLKLSKRFLIVQSVVSLESENEDYFVTPAPGWKHGSRFSTAFLRRLLHQAGWNIVDSHFNELEGNTNLCDRGSVYFLCTKAGGNPTGSLQVQEKRIVHPSIHLFDTPNKYAPPARLRIDGKKAHVDGYQGFILTRESAIPLQAESGLGIKYRLLSRFLGQAYFKHRTVLDLGANAGFFSYLALQHGAASAVAVEIDNDYICIMEEIKTTLGFSDLSIMKVNVENWSAAEDVVFAFALVHWVYSCTATYGSLDAVVEKFASLTNYMLLVEWVDPEDTAISFFRHTDWNKEIIKEPYTRQAFEAALGRHFVRFEQIGDISPTRRLYVAFCTRHEVDLSCPLPLLAGKDRIISCRRLTTWNRVDYWSCVYDSDGVILKQATLDLAEREAYFLRQLASPYFPKVFSTENKGEYSVVIIERIPGDLLRDRKLAELNSPAKFYTFAQHCLSLLGGLREKAILHRDIRPDNILLLEGRPVLIDFGWAVSPERPYYSPTGLGGPERPPDGSFCDIYSMGKVLEHVNDGRFPEFSLAISLMTQTDPTMRITDIALLVVLFAAIAKCQGLA